MDWPKITPSEKEYPENIVNSNIAGFSQATEGLAALSVTELNMVAKISSNLNSAFQFAVNLTSPQLKRYTFEVFRFGYDIELFPVEIICDSEIKNEITKGENPKGTRFIAKDEEMLRRLMDMVFKSNRFLNVVRGLLKIAQKNIATQISDIDKKISE
jgi:hypothetical protein